MKLQTKEKLTNYKKANLGMQLETMINESNKFYLTYNKAIIYKKPTPIQVVNVSYPSRSKTNITNAFYKTPSTTDYNGVYKGYYIDFEAKVTSSKTSFSFNNIHKHQIRHLQLVNEHKGIAFLIINFSCYDEYYLLPFKVLNKYYEQSLCGGPKSISYALFKEHAYLIKEKYKPRLDYLEVLDEKIIKN